ncbi:MAG: hypothetical protein JSV33_07925 [bacterium]|nr:MAG: hypothetical protein JSV33_07925 [bacterium]
MKKVLIIVALLLVYGSAFAQPVGYIGLFVDDSHSFWCAEGSGFYSFEMWIWCLPSERGMICAEFMCVYPANVIQSTLTTNPIVSVTLGTLDTGMSVCYFACEWDWNWPFHQTLWVTDATESVITIEKHPDPNIVCIQFANCEPGYPTECVSPISMIEINHCTNAVDESSWSAIKGLLNR